MDKPKKYTIAIGTISGAMELNERFSLPNSNVELSRIRDGELLEMLVLGKCKWPMQTGSPHTHAMADMGRRFTDILITMWVGDGCRHVTYS